MSEPKRDEIDDECILSGDKLDVFWEDGEPATWVCERCEAAPSAVPPRRLRAPQQ